MIDPVHEQLMAFVFSNLFLKRFKVFITRRMSGLGLENGTVPIFTDLGVQLPSTPNRYE
jgi:hypothetical protein